MAISSISGNASASAAQANISRASANAASSISRLSSGNKIVKASDDVAGLSVGTSLRTQVTSLRAALGNASQGTSLLQVADGALSQIVDILQRQKAIASQASSGQLTDTDRGYLNQEFQGLKAQIDAIAQGTNFNGVTLLNGGLGTITSLSQTDAQSAGFTNAATASGNGTAANSVTAIQAFNVQTGAVRSTTAAGDVQIVDAANAVLTNAAFNSVNSSLVGKIESVKLTDVTYGVAAAGSATLTVTIGGLEYSGRVSGNAGAQSVNLINGSTRLRFSLAAGQQDYTNSATTNLSEQNFFDAFRLVTFQRTSTIDGVDFSGTRLEGAVGIGGTGIASARLSSSNAVISNFQYAGNTGAANTSRLTVDINGTTFVATAVNDAITSAAGKLVFQSEDAQMFSINLTGLDIDFTATDNIRLNLSTRAQFLNALNAGFSKAGSGLDFQIGTKAEDSLKVSLASASTSSLFQGQTVGISTASEAQAASIVLDTALITATSLRAAVGALQSRFNFASANLDTSIQNQDAARGTLLDTDVSTESTAYSTAQVQLQAGIAVLAQANQLPQNLLKLIQ